LISRGSHASATYNEVKDLLAGVMKKKNDIQSNLGALNYVSKPNTV